MSKFKPIRFEDLKLTPEEMKNIAKGAARFMVPPPEDDKKTPEPLVTKRVQRDTI